MPSNQSFIDANEMTATSLAALLVRLASNEQEYNKYLEFKNKPLPASFLDITSSSYTHPNVLCRLCDYYANKVS